MFMVRQAHHERRYDLRLTTYDLRLTTYDLRLTAYFNDKLHNLSWFQELPEPFLPE